MVDGMTQAGDLKLSGREGNAKAVDRSIDRILPDRAVSLFKTALWIRCVEEALAAAYAEQEMRTPTHFGIGQEAVAAGVCEALAEGDVVYTHHRSHNHYLAKGGDVFKLAAELYGREAGCSHGRGGSVHLTARDKGFIISSAILGETIAVATGSALAFKMDAIDRVAVTFFGDASCEEGIFYETLNYASVHNLPVLFICENNLYSTESSMAVRQPRGTKLCDRVRSFQIPAESIDGNNVFEVYLRAAQARARIRVGGGPQFIECMTYRWREHVGPQFDHEAGRHYRSKRELEEWQEKCPVQYAGSWLVNHGLADAKDLAEWEHQAKQKVADAITRAKAASWPNPNNLFDNTY